MLYLAQCDYYSKWHSEGVDFVMEYFVSVSYTYITIAHLNIIKIQFRELQPQDTTGLFLILMPTGMLGCSYSKKWKGLDAKTNNPKIGLIQDSV